MEVRSCSGGALELPVMCVGTWSFGGVEGDYWGKQDFDATAALISASVEEGVGFFDTAELYNAGRSEEVLGKVLAERGLRDQVVLCSKIPPDACHPGGPLRQRLVASLERLQTGSLDIYMVHWPFKEAFCWKGKMPTAREAFTELAALQKEGLFRHIGVSNFGPKQLREALGCGVKIALNELSYSLFSRGIEFEVVEICREHDIGILAYSPLMQGLLTGKFETPDEVPEMRARTRHFKGTRPSSRHGGPGHEEEMFRELAAIKAVAAREGMSMAELGVAWVLANPAVTSVIVGSRDVEQLKQNARFCRTKLRDEVVEELNTITDPLKAALGSVIDYYTGDADCRSE